MRRAVAVALLGLVAALTAVPPTPAGPIPERGDVLRLAWWTGVGFPTPFAFSTVGPGGVVRLTLLYDTLVWKDERGIIPWLAAAWRIADGGRRITFALRPGARWHDGRPVTAADVRFTFDYYRRHPFLWADAGIVQAVEVEGAHAATVVLREPFAPFLADIAGVVPIIPEHIWRAVDDPRRRQTPDVVVGSGPYRLVAYRPAAGEYRFRANPDFFGGAPRYAEIHYTVLPPERQVLAVAAGQIDAALAETADVEPAFAGHPRLRVWPTAPLSIGRLLFNLKHPPLDNRLVRQALAHALNRAGLAALVVRGPGLAGNPGLVPPGDPWHSAGVRLYPYDPVRARRLLADAGVERLGLELLASPSPVVMLIQQMLGQAGLEATVRTVDAQTRAALITEGRFQTALTTHIGAGGDPDYLRRWFVGEEANQFGGAVGFAHPRYQALAARQARTLDVAERRRLVAEMQAILAEELPTLPLFHRRFYWVYDAGRMAPVATPGGIMNGIPLIDNKLALIRR
jgi:peptide/nickel transport system substrate-binding protein